VAVREAATVMLVRDAVDLEVFMLRRNPRSAFAGGASVFPGGAVDPEDASPRALLHVVGLEAADPDHRLGTAGAARFWVAAVRESFEEAGVMLARSRATGAPLDPDVARGRLAADRRRLLAGTLSFPDVLDAHDAALDLDALVPFARWITPPGAPRRFDTWFFLAAAPRGHTYEHDADELVASEWIRPADALARARAGEIDLVYPTVRTLLVMARFHDARTLLDAARARWRTAPEPLRVMNPDQGWQLGLPSDAEHAADDQYTRDVMRGPEAEMVGVAPRANASMVAGG
jgi:8-oxo-dGTP pyrophosphatase MutT (NUDIX family)